MLYRESLSAHEWSPVVPSHLIYIQNERQWNSRLVGKWGMGLNNLVAT